MSQAHELTAIESHALAEAIFQAMEAGDREAAKRLGQLARSPEKIRVILGRGRAPEGDEGEDESAE